MFFLQVANTATKGGGMSILLSTLIMVAIGGFVVFFVLYFQRRMVNASKSVKRLEIERQANMIRASIKFQEDERNRIAADLHDDAGPLLATVRLYLNEGFLLRSETSQLQAIFSARQIIDDTIELLRNISHSLMPPTLKNFGLKSAVTNIFEKINGSGKIAATARFNDYDEKLEPEKEMLCFRVVQELVNNIIKHSNASFIHIVQNRADNKIFLLMQHDGNGLIQKEFERLITEGEGLGLKNIQNRMKVLFGEISFFKDKEDGAYKITIVVPVKKEEG
jgi:two-component system, NarL family, sensor kinase